MGAMVTKMAVAALAWLGLSAMQFQPAPSPAPAEIRLWRLDCGAFVMKQYGAFFSDTFQYPAGAKNIVGSCYLIRHGNRYMLWDTGMAASLVGSPVDNPMQRITLRETIAAQLARIGVRPEQIEIIGISHYHGDHTGQARHFPQAKLVIGAADAAALRATPAPGGGSPDDLAHWLKGEGKVVEATGDIDIFQDGRVVMIDLPGHTPGHFALLVRLASGPVLLSGDLYHFTEQVANRGVPPFNHDRADTLASMDRFDRMARNLGAKVIIQHEPADIAKLPAFPQAAQ
jgi:glyoxylase-like metal-dependent hydrolase (beta-lactamase superfamily II)